MNDPIVIDPYGNALGPYFLNPVAAVPAQLALTRTASGEIVPVYIVNPAAAVSPLSPVIASQLLGA